MKRMLSLCMLALSWASLVLAQTGKITGKVTAEDGSPLAGVTVAAKVGGQTVQTDGDGVFSISAAKSDQLIFTMVGYQSRELSAGLPTPIQVAMQADNARLNEVVVVGYGTQSRRNVTSAISKLDAQVLASTPRANVGTALQGTVSGLQVVNATGSPGATPLIVLRGGASINSPGAPLVVVDGIIRDAREEWFSKIAPAHGWEKCDFIPILNRISRIRKFLIASGNRYPHLFF